MNEANVILVLLLFACATWLAVSLIRRIPFGKSKLIVKKECSIVVHVTCTQGEYIATAGTGERATSWSDVDDALMKLAYTLHHNCHEMSAPELLRWLCDEAAIFYIPEVPANS